MIETDYREAYLKMIESGYKSLYNGYVKCNQCKGVIPDQLQEVCWHSLQHIQDSYRHTVKYGD